MTLRIICHMISSVDGRLLTSRWADPYRPADITECYEKTASRFPSDGWIVGRATMAEYAESIAEMPPSLRETPPESFPEPFAGRRDGRPLAVVFDPKAKLHFTEPALPTGEHLVAVLTPQASPGHLASLQKAGVSYVFEKDASDLKGALDALEALFGVRTLLLEGGGILNGAFLEAGLIDELSVLIYPALDGLFGSPSIIGAIGPAEALPGRDAHLELLQCEPLPGGVVWLHYTVHRTCA